MTITAKVIADSISKHGQRITTFELEYPRFIHAEFMTHRLFSRNAASSRAIPVKKAIELIRNDTARPIHWGKNQPGMSAKEECHAPVLLPIWSGAYSGQSHDQRIHGGLPNVEAWDIARENAIIAAEAFDRAGYHKQIVNRIIEPYSHIKVVVTATEFDNGFWLRRHNDAQPEIHALFDGMWDAREASTPVELDTYDWHVPYYANGHWINSSHKLMISPNDVDEFGVTLDDAIAISSSCCAQVSYRRLDDSLEKARDIFKRLVESKPVHASPFEHQATPMDEAIVEAAFDIDLLSDGVTHVTRDRSVWSGNFRGWIQHRQLIPDHTVWNYQPE